MTGRVRKSGEQPVGTDPRGSFRQEKRPRTDHTTSDIGFAEENKSYEVSVVSRPAYVYKRLRSLD